MAVKKDTGTPQAKSVELLVAMTGKASPAKAAEGDKPVFAYIESLPEPQKSIAKHVDALAAKALPDLKRAVKWLTMAFPMGGASLPAPSSVT